MAEVKVFQVQENKFIFLQEFLRENFKLILINVAIKDYQAP